MVVKVELQRATADAEIALPVVVSGCQNRGVYREGPMSDVIPEPVTAARHFRF